ncbi:hypothetical protein TBR22_A12990 [Luteitalea sp. TBR-22]|uniref:DUF2252 domain-containing protein n=1 Tax=Luteitalea sp. TBR-22 TaxID=2802971 RepID=UPI001AF37C6D|nr:DUF2252 family protein [Luteitalea sp. TBR-22]BCS32090.1 hypothetical protein TBR22_A12990 [Luteitalea sp. TBR-22]
MNVAQAILDYNSGRDPEMLRRKFAILRADPYAFYRGTCHLFYDTLPRHAVLADAPALLVCGDLHLENFGVYKGDNRLAYFDLSDFDEATLAPFTFDVLRFMGSIHVAAHLRLSPRQAETLGELFVDRYRAWILDGKARWLERQTADGMVRDLLGSVIERTRAQLLKARTVRTARGRRLRMTDRALPIAEARRARLKAAIERFGAEQGDRRFYRVLDAAWRVAGKGSLGLERYVVLVEGKGSPRGNYLLDVKQAVPSTLPVSGGHTRWASQAERVVTLQRVAQAISPALLHTLTIGGRSFVLKELQPMTDRLDLERWDGRLARLESAVASMAAVTAWAHLRGCYRHGASRIEDLQRYVARPAWQRAMPGLAARCSALALGQWAAYSEAYDRGEVLVP